MRGSWSLGRRMMAASAALALLVCAGLAILVVAITRLQDATSRERRSKDVTVATLSLEKVVLDLDAGVRGFVISGKPRLLAPWTAGLHQLPRRIAVLRRLVRDDRAETRRVNDLVALIHSYESDSAKPLR